VIVLDSAILIDHLRGRREATDAFANAVRSGEQTAASCVTKVEVLAGMRAHERRATRALFELLRWLPVDDSIAALAGEYARTYRRSHQGIDVPDFIVAATAMRADAELWTRNVKHFPMFAGLEPPY
jgi:predicted nucleic acid-binding protein